MRRGYRARAGATPGYRPVAGFPGRLAPEPEGVNLWNTGVRASGLVRRVRDPLFRRFPCAGDAPGSPVRHRKIVVPAFESGSRYAVCPSIDGRSSRRVLPRTPRWNPSLRGGGSGPRRGPERPRPMFVGGVPFQALGRFLALAGELGRQPSRRPGDRRVRHGPSRRQPPRRT